jgi:hypothetical protein
MRKMYFFRQRFILGLLGFTCLAGFGHLAYAQSDWVVRDTFEPTAPRLLYTSARALGMLRGNREREIWLSLRYEGSGFMHQVTDSDPSDWPRIELDRYYAEIAYPDGGLRYDLTTSDGKRRVLVSAGDYSWEEQNVPLEGPPWGEYQTSAPDMHSWMQNLLTVTPTAAIRLAHDNVDQVQVTERDHRIYELSVPYNNMKIRLNRNRRPELVEMMVNHPVLGEATLSVEYSGYQDYEPIDPLLSDEMMSGFYSPGRIVQKLNGHTILDVEIDTCWCTNPYVIFPIPENVQSTSASR